MNWWYGDNGVRIALDGGHLSEEAVNDDNTHGLGNHLAADGKNGVEMEKQYKIEISNIQDCPFFVVKVNSLKYKEKIMEVQVSLKVFRYMETMQSMSPRMQLCFRLTQI